MEAHKELEVLASLEVQLSQPQVAVFSEEELQLMQQQANLSLALLNHLKGVVFSVHLNQLKEVYSVLQALPSLVDFSVEVLNQLIKVFSLEAAINHFSEE